MDKLKFVHEYLKPYFARHIRMECSCEKCGNPCLIKRFINNDISREDVYKMAVKDEVDRRE